MVNRLLEGGEVKYCYAGDTLLGWAGAGVGVGSSRGQAEVWEHPQDGGDALSLQE